MDVLKLSFGERNIEMSTLETLRVTNEGNANARVKMDFQWILII